MLLQHDVRKKCAGIDGTEAFIEAHGDDRNVLKVLNSLTVGELHDEAGILSMQEEVTHAFLFDFTLLSREIEDHFYFLEEL